MQSNATTIERRAPYRSDRNEGRLKIKTAQRGRFPIAGFVKDPTGVVALYLGKREDRARAGRASSPVS
jgi:hypothetical protein